MKILRIPRSRIRRNERGAVLMLIALSMSAVIATTGVIVDGSNAFAQRRQMQNAADSAALAGARALDKLAVNAEAAIRTAVIASAVANGANAADITCRLASDVLVDLGACPVASTGTATTLRNTVSAVKVTVGATTDTSFIRVAGIDTFTARASATAQIQGLRSGASPFALCAVGDSDPRAAGDGQSVPVLLPDNSMNPNALGVEYELQDPNPVNCGQGSQWKGLTEDFSNEFPLPGVWDLENGNHGINVAKAIAGPNSCNGSIVLNCVLLVPLCHATDPPASGALFCQRFGAFRIVDVHSSSRIAGVLVDSGVVSGGLGGGHAEVGEARVIKLSE